MKTPVNKASRSLIARVWNGALCKQAVGFLPGTLCSSQELSGYPPSLCSACINGSLNGTRDGQALSLLPLLTLEDNFLLGLPVLPVVDLLGPQAAAGPGLCRRPASHAASQLVVEQECISQKPCLISPGDCWCLKPSTQIHLAGSQSQQNAC